MPYPPQFSMNLVGRPVAARVAGNPNYPSGTPVDLSHGAVVSCVMKYEKMPIGLYYVVCNVCGSSVIVNVTMSGTIAFACRIDKGAKAALVVQPQPQ